MFYIAGIVIVLALMTAAALITWAIIKRDDFG